MVGELGEPSRPLVGAGEGISVAVQLDVLVKDGKPCCRQG